MADIRAFRGWRYNLARVGELRAVVAPPYDVIGPQLEAELLERHPANIVRVELAKEPPQQADPGRYERAARCLADWKRSGVLIEESDPALYVCHQRFEANGRVFTRRGFLARIRIEPFGQGRVYAHEETMPGPKADRLKLYHATGMNISPIFGMYPDPENEVQEVLENAIRSQTAIEAADDLGVVSRLWPVYGSETIGRVCSLMAPRSVFIADGHHRYETAARYREERRAARGQAADEGPEDCCMMMCVSMSDPGLLILPTHRLVSELGGLTSGELHRSLESEFDVTEIGTGDGACRDAWSLIESEAAQDVLGFGTVADGRWLVARLRSPDHMARLVPGHSATWRGLGVSILHELVLGVLLADRVGSQGPRCRYVHLIDEVLEGCAARRCDVACLVPPAGMDHVEQIASTGERMPAKSTYFYPKLLTGLVLNPIA